MWSHGLSILINAPRPVHAQSEAWWKRAAEMMSDPAKTAANNAAAEAAGCFNHSFLPCSPPSTMVFCILEAKEGLTEAEFTEFLNGPEGPGGPDLAFSNHVHVLNIAMAGGYENSPYTKHF